MADNYQVMEELGSTCFRIPPAFFGTDRRRRVLRKSVQSHRPQHGRDGCYQACTCGSIVPQHIHLPYLPNQIDLEDSNEELADIQAEIALLSTCHSPYITEYKTSFVKGVKLWIVMEFLGGGSAADLLAPGPVGEAHIAIMCRELLLGLDYLHSTGKIHRDIKAANVLLTDKGKVKLADFGVAAQLTNMKSQRMTFVGTPFWMAPEVIQEAGYDFRADIWSLGITAMELADGAPPHAGVHPMKVLFTIPKNPAPRLQGDQFSKEFKDFIAQCLIKDPDRRATAKELLEHKFIRRAGKVEALRELIERKQMFDAKKDKDDVLHPKYYEETM